MIGSDIEYAAQCIREGKLVAFPTETVYGLGANALDSLAVARIFESKERPSFDPLIVHIATIEMLYDLAEVSDSRVETLARAFWPGPLTIVLPKKDIVPDIVSSGLKTVGIRMPRTKIALDLIAKSACPLAAPSANKFGQLSPTTAEHVVKQLPELAYVLDGGKTEHGLESTVVTFQDSVCKILRPGVITKEDIQHILPDIQIEICTTNTEISAPGLLHSHYSPRKPLYIIDDCKRDFPKHAGLIAHAYESKEPSVAHLMYTSLNGNVHEIATELFAALHTMEDAEDVKEIYILSVPKQGLGIAIMDRLEKAAFKYLGKNTSL